MYGQVSLLVQDSHFPTTPEHSLRISIYTSSDITSFHLAWYCRDWSVLLCIIFFICAMKQHFAMWIHHHLLIHSFTRCYTPGLSQWTFRMQAQPCPHLDFRLPLPELCSCFRPSEFVVIYYGGPRTWIHFVWNNCDCSPESVTRFPEHSLPSNLNKTGLLLAGERQEWLSGCSQWDGLAILLH